jgi:hypothetical protein
MYVMKRCYFVGVWTSEHWGRLPTALKYQNIVMLRRHFGFSYNLQGQRFISSRMARRDGVR